MQTLLSTQRILVGPESETEIPEFEIRPAFALEGAVLIFSVFTISAAVWAAMIWAVLALLA